jgi:pimeloyl-ACP methyl ester carboxylesterase
VSRITEVIVAGLEWSAAFRLEFGLRHSERDQLSAPLNVSIIVAAVLLVVFGLAAAAERSPRGSVDDAYDGDYRATDGHMIGIDRFVNDAGDRVVLISDYQSGIVRQLFPISDSEFVMGPGFAVQSPAELKVRFVRDARGKVTGISLQPTGGQESFAERVPLAQEEVVFTNGQVRLAGTLMIPATKGPHPAIILLHGSGPLTRYSFGPYPHFFTSLGFAVLIFDKRGTGASTGARLDASTGDLKSLPTTYYPDDLVNDALAAFRFLQQLKEINPREVGFWGSSEGGMLSTQVAARDRDVAFAIDSSGFMGPLWQTLLYQDGVMGRGSDITAPQVDEAVAFTKLWMRVARTGEGYELFLKKRGEAVREKKPWLLSWTSADFTSLEQMRWDWDHILSFSPLPALTTVTCPVLGVWGELDTSTSAADAARNMRVALSGAGNRDVTVKIFPNANHPLMEMPSGNKMAPGVFETLRSWLQKRVHLPAVSETAQ